MQLCITPLPSKIPHMEIRRISKGSTIKTNYKLCTPHQFLSVTYIKFMYQSVKLLLNRPFILPKCAPCICNRHIIQEKTSCRRAQHTRCRRKKKQMWPPHQFYRSFMGMYANFSWPSITSKLHTPKSEVGRRVKHLF